MYKKYKKWLKTLTMSATTLNPDPIPVHVGEWCVMPSGGGAICTHHASLSVVHLCHLHTFSCPDTGQYHFVP